MSDLTTKATELSKLAGDLLNSSNLLKLLNRYGHPELVGSYPAGLMVNGDIDIHVTRDEGYTREQALEIFNGIFRSTSFMSNYIGDWNNTGLHPEFPEGYYLGLKTRFADMPWKIGIWLVSSGEQTKFDSQSLVIGREKITDAQREAILIIKKHCKDSKIKANGQAVYEAVLRKGINSVEGFLKLLQ